MAYEDLITAVEVSARERIREIQERSKVEAEEIIRNAQAKDGPIRKRHLDKAIVEVELQRNRLFSAAREENRLKMLEIKNEFVNATFDEAGRKLAVIREHPQYRSSLKMLINQIVRELGEKDVILHIDPRDSTLCRELLAELKVNCDVVADLSSAGGLNAHTRDERFVMGNTFESRLKRAKEVYRPDIVSILFGD
jgi:vacuolar-type H+-ATPase subunit E/Vma4